VSRIVSIHQPKVFRPAPHANHLAAWRVMVRLFHQLDAKDRCTAGHSDRVSRIAVHIGRQMGLDDEALRDLRLAGLLHDVGKIVVRDDVLLKPGELTTEERDHLRTHVLLGDRILSSFRSFARLRPAVRSHHERFDGKGYPDGLAGAKIPLAGRILAVADACDAMMSTRRYRDALPPPHMHTVLRAHAGAQWDPAVVEAFMACRHAVDPPVTRRSIGDSAVPTIDPIMEEWKDFSPAAIASSKNSAARSCQISRPKWASGLTSME
jgi:putative nucleotidyltransferase with HDIG domain